MTNRNMTNRAMRLKILTEKYRELETVVRGQLKVIETDTISYTTYDFLY